MTDVIRFPDRRPPRASFIQPADGATLGVSPPGFAWWRAGERGRCRYRLYITSSAGKALYESPPLDDPVHVPTKTLPAGRYVWRAVAVDDRGRSLDADIKRQFAIERGAPAHPWVDPAGLLANVRAQRPRLLFAGDELTIAREQLSTSRAEAFASLKAVADAALELPPLAEPDYDRIEEPAPRRMAYFDAFARTRRHHDSGMRHLALMYLLSGEAKYGRKAREKLLEAAAWKPEGISSLLAPHGDEVGLGLVKVAAEVYDWIFDLLDEADQQQAEAMLIARGNQMLRRLEKQDYLAQPENSHNGRLPGYLLEHAIALAEHPRSQVWADYALRALMTWYPHWGGTDGGWAEGVPYGLHYNQFATISFEAWRRATGQDLWANPFYRQMPWFFAYCLNPIGEIMPFGDQEQMSVNAGGARTLIQFHALRLGEPALRQWVDRLRQPKTGEPPKLAALPGLLLEDDLEPGGLEALSPDRAFGDVGVAAMHTHLAEPDRDLHVLLRSSPYGGVSHGHASQNDIAIIQGGRALVCAGGERFPTHGTPFHTRYAQQSQSHNTVLINGDGQVNRDGDYGGRIAEFQSSDALAFVCGDASEAYAAPMKRFHRHLLLIRPASIIVMVDDLAADEPSTFQWLLHAWEPFDVDAGEATFASRRDGAELLGRLFSDRRLNLTQTDAWPVEPDEGYPDLDKPLPPKRWHLTAGTDQAAACRIAAVMRIGDQARPPIEADVSRAGDVLSIAGSVDTGRFEATVRLAADARPLLEARFHPTTGETDDVVSD